MQQAEWLGARELTCAASKGELGTRVRADDTESALPACLDRLWLLALAFGDLSSVLWAALQQAMARGEMSAPLPRAPFEYMSGLAKYQKDHGNRLSVFTWTLPAVNHAAAAQPQCSWRSSAPVCISKPSMPVFGLHQSSLTGKEHCALVMVLQALHSFRASKTLGRHDASLQTWALRSKVTRDDSEACVKPGFTSPEMFSLTLLKGLIPKLLPGCGAP